MLNGVVKPGYKTNAMCSHLNAQSSEAVADLAEVEGAEVVQGFGGEDVRVGYSKLLHLCVVVRDKVSVDFSGGVWSRTRFKSMG